MVGTVAACFPALFFWGGGGGWGGGGVGWGGGGVVSFVEKDKKM